MRLFSFQKRWMKYIWLSVSVYTHIQTGWDHCSNELKGYGVREPKRETEVKVGLIKEKLDGYVKRGAGGKLGEGGNERKFDIMSRGWRCGGEGVARTSTSLKTDICLRVCGLWWGSVRAELNPTHIYPASAVDFFTPLRNKMKFLVLVRIFVLITTPVKFRFSLVVRLCRCSGRIQRRTLVMMKSRRAKHRRPFLYIGWFCLEQITNLKSLFARGNLSSFWMCPGSIRLRRKNP